MRNSYPSKFFTITTTDGVTVSGLGNIDRGFVCLINNEGKQLPAISLADVAELKACDEDDFMENMIELFDTDKNSDLDRLAQEVADTFSDIVDHVPFEEDELLDDLVERIKEKLENGNCADTLAA